MNNKLNDEALETDLDKRSKFLRKLAVKALESGKRAHLGSAMSIIEIIRVIYDDYLNLNADNLNDINRDRFILSKGHGCLAQYVLLADKGIIDEQELKKFCQFDSINFYPGSRREGS